MNDQKVPKEEGKLLDVKDEKHKVDYEKQLRDLEIKIRDLRLEQERVLGRIITNKAKKEHIPSISFPTMERNIPKCTKETFFSGVKCHRIRSTLKKKFKELNDEEDLEPLQLIIAITALLSHYDFQALKIHEYLGKEKDFLRKEVTKIVSSIRNRLRQCPPILYPQLEEEFHAFQIKLKEYEWFEPLTVASNFLDNFLNWY